MLRSCSFISFLCLGLLLSGCFNVREPEPPGTTSGWTTPTEAEILLTNFSTAVTTLNTSNYERCLAAGRLRFLPDPAVSNQSNSIFNNWSITEERDYFTSLADSTGQAAGHALEFSNKRQNFFNTDSVELSLDYVLTIRHQARYPEHTFNGLMVLVLVRKNNEWRINTWRDSRNSDQPCWTDLKRYFFTN